MGPNILFGYGKCSHSLSAALSTDLAWSMRDSGLWPIYSKKMIATVRECTEADAAWAFASLRVQASTIYTEQSPLAIWPDVPVIDVRGHIMVGFDAHSIDSALGSPI